MERLLWSSRVLGQRAPNINRSLHMPRSIAWIDGAASLRREILDDHPTRGDEALWSDQVDGYDGTSSSAASSETATERRRLTQSMGFRSADAHPIVAPRYNDAVPEGVRGAGGMSRRGFVAVSPGITSHFPTSRCSLGGRSRVGHPEWIPGQARATENGRSCVLPAVGDGPIQMLETGAKRLAHPDRMIGDA
jgi:hypothetical protein